MFAILKKIPIYNKNFARKFGGENISKFYTDTGMGPLSGLVGAGIGTLSGLLFLTEYHYKKAYNSTVTCINNIIDESEKFQQNNKTQHKTTQNNKTQNTEEIKIDIGIGTINVTDDGAQIKINKMEKYDNPFSFVIIENAPISVNVITSGMTGAFIGYIYGTCWFVTIPTTILYNTYKHYTKDKKIDNGLD